LLLDERGGLLTGNNVKGVLCIKRPWPGLARSIHGDHRRYMQTYMETYKDVYFTGDGAWRDSDGYYWVTGRVDDVVNVSGHRIGSAEIESALVAHSAVSEAAVIGIPHNIKGQALFAYVTPKEGIHASPQLLTELKNSVRTHVGAFALPDHILITAAFPKTRSGKIMRRILRKIACNETDPSSLGDLTTLADPSVVDKLIKEVADLRKADSSQSSK